MKGDLLLVSPADLYAMHELKDHSQHLRGLHREIWEGVDQQEHVKREREAWQE